MKTAILIILFFWVNNCKAQSSKNEYVFSGSVVKAIDTAFIRYKQINKNINNQEIFLLLSGGNSEGIRFIQVCSINKNSPLKLLLESSDRYYLHKSNENILKIIFDTDLLFSNLLNNEDESRNFMTVGGYSIEISSTGEVIKSIWVD